MSAAFDAQILARTVWLEAEGEPFEGKLAVAHVMLNRWRSRKWFAGATIAATCLKKKQVSGWNSDQLNGTRREKVCTLTADQLAECQAAAMAALLGTMPDPTGGCTHYHHISIAPDWSHGKTPVVTIGKHSYYNTVT